MISDTIQMLMLRTLFSFDPNISCEEVGVTTMGIMALRQHPFSQINVQQYYDEVGAGEGFESIIQYAYDGYREEYDKYGKSRVIKNFGKLFEDSCKRMER